MSRNRNRDWLNNQNPCDLLKQIHEHIEGCVLRTISHDVTTKRCWDFNHTCDKCIEAWMNEERK
jgi:hypothetical protein